MQAPPLPPIPPVVIVPPIANPNTFADLLARTCGITNANAILAITVEQGITSLDDLSNLNKDEIYTMVTAINKRTRRINEQVTISALSLKFIRAVREWIKWQMAFDLPFNDNRLYDIDARTRVLERMEFESRLKDADVTVATPPKPLMSIGYKAWIPFWKQFQAYCSTIRGVLKIPLSYVYREHDEVTDEIRDAEYDTVESRISALVVLEGPFFSDDNLKVWQLLEPLVNTGDVWPFVKSFQSTGDGRGALERLRGITEGAASKVTVKALAKQSLREAKYTGQSKNFTFDSYIAKLQTAFNDLEESNDPYSESSKVDALLQGIRFVDYLKPAAFHVVGSPTLGTDFNATVTYLKSMVSINQTYDSATTSNRNVASATTTNDKFSDLKDKYTSEEWKKLPQETKNRVIKRNAAKKANGGDSMKSLKRKVKSLTKENSQLKTDGSAETTGTAPNVTVAAATTTSNKK